MVDAGSATDAQQPGWALRQNEQLKGTFDENSSRSFRPAGRRQGPTMIETIEQLRTLYPQPRERSLKKQLSSLDPHCKRFIELSPFLVIATGSQAGFDASPRGGEPGFVKVMDHETLWLPDSPGNNRLDSLENIVETGRVGLVFFVPGVDETLRINGAAQLTVDGAILQTFASAKRVPKVVIQIRVEEAYLHCAKALMRSKLWDAESRNDRSVLPTMGKMMFDHTGLGGTAESQQEMIARYQNDL